jgi:CBS domain-containing protein
MAETGRTSLPVVSREDGAYQGNLTLEDLLEARVAHLAAESRRRRHFRIADLVPF